MKRSIPIAIALVMLAAAASGMSLFFNQFFVPLTPSLNEEQRVIRERFFGAVNKAVPIKNGQEMRPRW